jgi:hypothetical protein
MIEPFPDFGGLVIKSQRENWERRLDRGDNVRSGAEI